MPASLLCLHGIVCADIFGPVTSGGGDELRCYLGFALASCLCFMCNSCTVLVTFICYYL